MATHWSLDTLVQAHMTLDLEDELAAKADEKAERDSRKIRGK